MSDADADVAVREFCLFSCCVVFKEGAGCAYESGDGLRVLWERGAI